MSMQFANVWERVADTVGDEIALINGDKKSTWSSYDSKAAKIVFKFPFFFNSSIVLSKKPPP